MDRDLLCDRLRHAARYVRAGTVVEPILPEVPV
jgi:hypothetical protein